MYPQNQINHPAAVVGTALRTLAAFEHPIKWLAVVLGLFSTFCVVQGWQLPAMVLSLPFCLIWIFFGWLRSEPQLVYINVVFVLFYLYGIFRHFLVGV